MSWQSGLLNDCEFVRSVVEAQASSGEMRWFQPQGCTDLTLLNSYHCTAEALSANTEYIFRVQTQCADPQSSSAYSLSSPPQTTLATVQSWEVSQRRVLSISMSSDVDFNAVMSNAQLRAALTSRIASHAATNLNVDSSTVQVEFLPWSQAAGRRLAASTVFSVTVEGAVLTNVEASSSVAAGVSDALLAETGTASTVSVTGTSSLTPATAPGKITWGDMGDGRLHLRWDPLPFGDCSFLAWHVLAHVGGGSALLSGCTNLMNLSKTECVASGMEAGTSQTFTVDVLCADPATNSRVSEPSDPWPLSSAGLLQGTLTAAPAVTSSCQSVTLLASSSGPVVVGRRWRLESQSFPTLQPLLDDATARAASAVTIPASILQGLVPANQDSLDIYIWIYIQPWRRVVRFRFVVACTSRLLRQHD